MIRPIDGVVRGKTIELTENPGFAEGQRVAVIVSPLAPTAQWGEGIRRSAGAWAHVNSIDRVMTEIAADRKHERRS